MTRKEFLNDLLITGSTILITPFISIAYNRSIKQKPNISNCSKVIKLDLNAHEFKALSSVGGIMHHQNLILMRTGITRFAALSKEFSHVHEMDYSRKVSNFSEHFNSRKNNNDISETHTNTFLSTFKTSFDGTHLIISS